MSVDIVLGRADRTYNPGEIVSGNIVVTADGSMSHTGLSMNINGKVTLQSSSKSVGLFDAFYASLKPITLMDINMEIQKSGKFNDGTTEIPFEFKLEPISGQTLYESYSGVYVNVAYILTVNLNRPFLGKKLQKSIAMVVETPVVKDAAPTPELINLSSEKAMETSKKVKGMPHFVLEGQFDTTECPIDRPFTGHIVFKECEGLIRSVELQLLRVETCGCADGFAKESTEIQNIQMCDGDVPLNLELPLQMVFPRLFTCPTVTAKTFKIEFEVSLMIMFDDGRHVNEKIPIRLIRAYN